MALNPPIMPGGTPMALSTEYFCLKRRSVDVKITSDAGNFSCDGVLFLTSLRMVFVASKPTARFSSIDIPLQGISEEKFKQPIFGANALTGNVMAVPGRGFTGQIGWRLTFNSGGCARFLRMFFHMMESYRSVSPVPRPTPSVNLFATPQAFNAFISEHAAYVNADDPSVVYLSQPVEAQPPPAQGPPPGVVAYGAPTPPPGVVHYPQPVAAPPYQQQVPAAAGYPPQPQNPQMWAPTHAPAPAPAAYAYPPAFAPGTAPATAGPAPAPVPYYGANGVEYSPDAKPRYP